MNSFILNIKQVDYVLIASILDSVITAVKNINQKPLIKDLYAINIKDIDTLIKELVGEQFVFMLFNVMFNKSLQLFK